MIFCYQILSQFLVTSTWMMPAGQQSLHTPIILKQYWKNLKVSTFCQLFSSQHIGREAPLILYWPQILNFLLFLLMINCTLIISLFLLGLNYLCPWQAKAVNQPLDIRPLLSRLSASMKIFPHNIMIFWDSLIPVWINSQPMIMFPCGTKYSPMQLAHLAI